MKKKIISLLLAVVMCLSVVACGGGNTAGGNKKNEAANKASKEGVFDVTDIEAMKEAIGSDDFSFDTFKAIDGKLRMVANVYLSNGYEIRYLVTDMDGNVETSMVLYQDIWEAPVEDAVQPKIAEISASVADVMEVYPEEIAPEAPEEQVWHNVYGSTILSDGKLAYIDNTETYNNSTGISKVEAYVVLCDESGTEISRVWVNENLPVEEYFYINSMVESETGTIYVMGYDHIFEVDLQGNILGQFEPNDVTRDLYRAAFYKNGYPVFTTWNEDWTKQSFKALDIRAGAVIEEITLFEGATNYSIYDGTNSGYDLVLTNNMGVYGFNYGDKEPKELMNYINSNLGTHSINNICFTDSEHFVGMYNDITEYQMHVASFAKVAPENVPDRQTLTLATLYAGSDIIKAVIDYNKNSDVYKITLKDYARYNTEENQWRGGIERFNNEIVSGNVPDIIRCSVDLPVANYASKGLLVDFYELMDKDETINREDYAENVFRAYETNGKLYELPTMFYIWTVYGKTAIWGEEPGITWEEVAAVQAKYPEASLFGNEMTKESALNNSLRFAYGQLVDEVTGECHFDSDVFKNLLEYANSYPAEINWDELYSSDDYWMHYQTQYIEDRTLLMQNTIYTPYEAWRYGKSSFNEPVTAVGFPSDSGMGSMITAVDSYAISAKSAHIDGAWDFVKQYISEENQTVAEDADRYSMWGLPVLKKGIEQQADFMTQKPFYIDENGNKVEQDDYIWINDEQIPIEPASAEERQRWVDFIYSVDEKQAGGYDKAWEIINEEVGGYFSGQKTVEEVMSIVQSRMSIFISESR